MADEQQADGSASSPRDILIRWAEGQDAWVRLLAGAVLETQGPVGNEVVDDAYETFLIEKGFVDAIESVDVPPLPDERDGGGSQESFSLLRLSDVAGVNALAEDQTIVFDRRLTVLFGRNGSGKTGYARVIKRAAGARRHEPILGDIGSDNAASTPRARFEIHAGGTPRVVDWRNEVSLAPLDRISVFDSELATAHVDSDLDYVFTPAELVRFGEVTAAIQDVQTRIQDRAATSRRESKLPVNPFTQGTRVHEIVNNLGATSPIGELRGLADLDEADLDRLSQLRTDFADLSTGSDRGRAAGLRRRTADLDNLLEILPVLSAFDAGRYNTSLNAVQTAKTELEELRETLFAADELAGTPDDAWQEFIEAGQAYAVHLDLHQYPQADDKCLYCRQPLEPQAVVLLRRYGEFLTGTAQTKLRNEQETLEACALRLDRGRLQRLQDAFQESQDSPDTSRSIHKLLSDALGCLDLVEGQDPCTDHGLSATASTLIPAVRGLRDEVVAEEKDLTDKQARREESIRNLRQQLDLLEDRQKLGTHMVAIEQCFKKSTESQQLQRLDQQISSSTLSSLTRASTRASQDLVNRDFRQLFEAECNALNAPRVKLEFRGRRGASQRQKHVATHKPSQILSEGEQKVLALADFLAECRMNSRRNPIVFDDPVSSLDYRRLEAVAERLVDLAAEHQVIVFTHNIMFVVALLELRNRNSQRIAVLQVRERDDRKGVIVEDFEPRLDTPNKLKPRINEAIEEARGADPGMEDRHISRIYGLLRNWCEAFVEQELLGDVAHRYRPNIVMGNLHAIKPERLRDAIAEVERVFKRASRHIEGHSNPNEVQNAPPDMDDVKKDWAALQKARKAYVQQ